MAKRTLVLGDSLGVGTVPYLRQLLQGRIDVDVKGGRSSADGVNHLHRFGGRYDRVLLDLGTNDSSAGQMLESIRRARKLAPGAAIFVATVHGPDAERKNRMLRNVGGGVQVVDWVGHSAGEMAGDGIHATPGGYKQRARLFAAAMRGAGAADGNVREPAAPPTASAPAAPSTSALDASALTDLLTRAPRQTAGLSMPQFSAQTAQPAAASNPLEDVLRKVMTKWR